METAVKRTTSLLALLLVLALCPALAFAQTGATAAPDHVALSWTASPATTMTVTWRTDTTTRVGLVEYCKGATLSGATRRLGASCSNFTTDQGTARLYRATLTNLSPNATYSYRVGDGARWSAARAFRTADPEASKVKFLVFGDSQSVPPYSTWQTTVHNAYKANPDARFMVNCGDLVDIGQNGSHWNAWYDATAGVIDTIPAMPALGNHETGGSKATRRPEYWVAQFTLPQNGPTGIKSQAYSFDYGPAHFTVLDSQQAEQKQHGDIFGPQKTWLDADLKAAKATWKFAFFHKAPYEVHQTRKSSDVKSAFCPILESNHVDIVFNGHDHGIARTYPIKGGKYMRKPSQGTIYFIAGRSGTKRYSDIEKKPWHTFFHNPMDQPNYLVVEIDGKKLTVRTMKQDGTLIDTFSIDKGKDIDSDLP